MKNAEFISCDWGTTTFRLRRVAFPELRVVKEIRELSGVKGIHSGLELGTAGRAEAFAAYFSRKLEEIYNGESVVGTEVPVVISGMASSSVGWKELPYARVPFALDGSAVVFDKMRLQTGVGIAEILLISGVATERDMMRGEETELLGALSAPEVSGLKEASVWILPGTHSKHIRVDQGLVVDFQTYMTGELFEVLGRYSLLKMTVQLPTGNEPEKRSFLEGVLMAKEKGLGRGLFRARSRSILEGRSGEENGWYLSGLIIGAEMVDLLESDWRGPVVLAASDRFRPSYELALKELGAEGRRFELPRNFGDNLTVRAHALLLKHLCPERFS